MTKGCPAFLCETIHVVLLITWFYPEEQMKEGAAVHVVMETSRMKKASSSNNLVICGHDDVFQL